ncbi:MAG: thiamine phosphate synthase [Gracilibacteraceae bacterium]|jgi:thiamine-phosphate pyrophosphorylase|nr:thiamine phosphate synthase [Gracilibacteraceae bacterium]
MPGLSRKNPVLSPAALRLYAITDSSRLGGRSLLETAAAVLRGGATMLQFREKNLALAEFVALGRELRSLAARFGAPFIVNDRVEAAAALDADGVHLGQADMDAGAARARLGPDKIIGVSARSVAQALKAEAAGADYLGVGAVFATTTKTDAAAVSSGALGEICRAARIPVVAIGGIKAGNAALLRGSGIRGIAAAAALFAAPDPEAAARELLRAWEYD